MPSKAISSDAYSEPRQTSKIELSAKVVHDKETDFHNIRSYFAGNQICFGMVSRITQSEA